MNDCVTFDEAADLLGIKRTSVKQLVSRGILQAVTIAGEDQRKRYLLRSQVEYRLAHPYARRGSKRQRMQDKALWIYERSLQRLLEVL